MSDWFTLATDMQREIIRAQKAQMDAAQKALGAGQRMIDLQEAGQKVAEANLSYWKQWAKLWGLK
ncbi:hypothetical protein [Sphingomonas turrisvirgatae]|uniref:Phasin domain-containing protein n=1 Tax=Sphingomonas turrisvirgatae TaxID=1888892 RepID=A0A1E3LSA0_9SPHN|nr:hypothetical protein [Sphingomonas turrisvirgatae]ODP36636.1 hypothetical protein BFL28_04815 [Sphingomonas turrisvirgatae]